MRKTEALEKLCVLVTVHRKRLLPIKTGINTAVHNTRDAVDAARRQWMLLVEERNDVNTKEGLFSCR